MNRALLIFFIVILLRFPSSCYAQNSSVCDSADTFTIADEMPEFPGGIAALMTYMAKNIKVREIKKNEAMPPSTFYIDFVIDKTGNARFTRIKPEGYIEDIKNKIENMPAWKPGKQDGKEACIKFVLPVRVEYK